MVGILQVNGFGEESTLMQDLKPFRILISLLDKPELGNTYRPRAKDHVWLFCTVS